MRSVDRIVNNGWAWMIAVAVLGATACSNPRIVQDDTTDGDTTGDTTDTGDDAEADSSTTGEPVDPCGNGIVEDDESCDDGNEINADGCNNDCSPSGALVWLEMVDGDNSDDEGRDVVIDSDGNIVVTGQIGGNAEEFFNVWLAKYDFDGNQIWAESIDGELASDRGIGLVPRSPDGVVVTGALGAEDFQSRPWVAAYDGSGAEVWSSAEDMGAGFAAATDGVLAPDGSTVVAGVNTIADDEMGMWVRRFDADGAELWIQNHTTGWQAPFAPWPAVALTELGFFVAGPIDTDTVVRRYNEQGDLLTFWNVTDISVTGLDHDGAGNLVLSGRNQNEFWVAKYDPSGEPMWVSDCNPGAAFSVAVDFEDNIVAVGRGEDAGDDELQICKLDPDGVELWRSTYGLGVGNHVLTGVAINAEGYIAATGTIWTVEKRHEIWIGVYTP